MGSHDLRVAERGAQLFLEHWAPLLIFSGGLGNLTRGVWEQPEADRFAEIAVRMGVPAGSNPDREPFHEYGREYPIHQRPPGKAPPRSAEDLSWCKNPIWSAGPSQLSGKFGRKNKCSSLRRKSRSRIIPLRRFPSAKVIGIMVGDLQRIRLYSVKRLSDSAGNSPRRLGGRPETHPIGVHAKPHQGIACSDQVRPVDVTRASLQAANQKSTFKAQVPVPIPVQRRATSIFMTDPRQKMPTFWSYLEETP